MSKKAAASELEELLRVGLRTTQRSLVDEHDEKMFGILAELDLLESFLTGYLSHADSQGGVRVSGQFEVMETEMKDGSDNLDLTDVKAYINSLKNAFVRCTES